MNFKFWRKKTIRAREFILEDDKGQERAALRMDSAGNSLLLFRGPDKKIRCFVGTTADGTPRLTLLYGNGKGTIELEANDQLNTAGVAICGATGKAKLVFAVTADGIPAIVAYDASGTPIVAHPASPAPLDDPAEMNYMDWDRFLRQ